MTDTVFAKIIAGEIPSEKLYEDEHCIVIPDINPVAAVHVLVIPKLHIKNILDIDDLTLSHLAVVSKNIGKQLIVKNNADGMNLLHAAEESAQQSVFHFHFHVVPRYDGDKLDLWFRNSL